MSNAEFINDAARLHPSAAARKVGVLTTFLFSELRPLVDSAILEQAPDSIHGIFDGLLIKELPLDRIDEAGVSRLGAREFDGRWEALKRMSLGTVQETVQVFGREVALPLRRKVVGLQTEGTGNDRNTVTTAAVFSDGSGLLIRKTHDPRTKAVVSTTKESTGSILIEGKAVPLNLALADFIARVSDFSYGTDYAGWLRAKIRHE